MQIVQMSALLVATLFLAFTPSNADLGDAVRRSGSRGAVMLPAGAPMDGPLVVPLERVLARDDSRATFYVGKLSIGQPPQELQVLFDTSSGHVLMPHRACKSTACVEHRHYSPWASNSAMDVNVDGSMVQEGSSLAQGQANRTSVNIWFTQADLGEGKAQAVVVRDHVCMMGLSGRACVDLEALPAISMDEVPFRAMPNDGIVGLGLESLSAGHLLSFLGRLFEGSQNVVPQFGISFGATSGSIYFGGHDPRLTAPIQWFPVDHPEDGYWQVAIQSVRVGNRTVDSCQKGCHGILDTGASRLGVQASTLPRMRDALVTALMPDGSCHGQELKFDLGGMVLVLQPQDYTDASCATELGALNLEEPQFVGVYAFGASVLRRYYAAFDWGKQRVGFAEFASNSLSVSAAILV